MEDANRSVEMVRIPREEKLYEREEIFGRDASSVFPTEGKATQPTMDVEATKAAIGALKFISESELKELASQRGARVEDGAVEPDKPLAEVLKENKDKKEEQFQAVWRSMKTGKNRPLDEDELDFVNAVLEAERKAEAGTAAEEAKALEAFQQEMREAAEKSAATRKSQQQQPVSQKQAAPGPVSARKPKILPVLPLKRAAPTSTGPQPVAQDVLNKVARQGGPPSIHLQQASMASASGNVTTKQDEEGLSGLLGAYGSDSECDS